MLIPGASPSVSGRATAAVVGGGPGGLMAAERLATAGVSVTVYEQMPSVGRKLLLAGRGGLNLTHSEPLPALLARYGSAAPMLEAAVAGFGADDLRDWCHGLGEPTFVGTSGRIFPESLRAAPLLRAWLDRLDGLGVEIKVRHRWTGWAPAVADSGQERRGLPRVTIVDGAGCPSVVKADVVVLALGGASWPNVGSDGRWVEPMERAGITVSPMRAANSGFTVDWSGSFVERFAGVPLKNVRFSAAGLWSRGEAMITETGIEGGGIYAVGVGLRDAIEAEGVADLSIDLQPDLAPEQLTARLAKRRPRDSMSSVLGRTVGLSPVAVGLLREVTANHLPPEGASLARLIKGVTLRLSGIEPIGRAISTAGGVEFDQIDRSFMLTRRPGTFLVGEMLDWEAPTGGYLLQATFSSAVAAADGALRWLSQTQA